MKNIIRDCTQNSKLFLEDSYSCYCEFILQIGSQNSNYITLVLMKEL